MKFSFQLLTLTSKAKLSCFGCRIEMIKYRYRAIFILTRLNQRDFDVKQEDEGKRVLIFLSKRKLLILQKPLKIYFCTFKLFHTKNALQQHEKVTKYFEKLTKLFNKHQNKANKTDNLYRPSKR